MRLAISARHCVAILTFIAAIATIDMACAQAEAPGEYRQLVPGMLSRSIFKGEAGKSTVEVIDLLVGPGKTSEDMTTPDRVILDVQAGDATLFIDGQSQRLRPGVVIPLDRDQRIAVDNSGGTRPFVARMIVVSPIRR